MRIAWTSSLVLVPLLFLVACGGGSSKTTSSSSGGVVTPPSGGGNTGGSTGALAAPSAVTVAPGSSATNVNISVPTGAPTLNAQVLGVSAINSSGGSASNTGGVVQRGSQASVLLFGKGLNAGLTVSILGPSDISISNVQSIKSTTGLPGVQFDVSVNADATPGTRTVVLQDASGNVTTFTGGLEIQ